jgi:hypothetical protein
VVLLQRENQVQEDVGIEDIDAAIRDLDGVHRTLLIIELTSGPTLTIGGGPETFVVECSLTETERWCVINATSATSASRSIDLVVGGSPVEYPARLGVGLDAALDAAHVFINENGNLSPRQYWSQET